MADRRDGSQRCLSPKACVAVTVLISCLGSTFVFGYCISVLNTPRQRIECFFLRTWLSDFQMKDSNASVSRQEFLESCDSVAQVSKMLTDQADTRLRWMYTMTVAVWVLFAAVGGFTSGLIVDRFGRRNSLLIANIFSLMAALSIAPTLMLNSPAFVYITRALSGMHNGLVIPMQSMYVMEIVPIRLRGAIGVSGQLSITIGIFVGGFVGLEQLLNRPKYWVLAIALSAVPSLISNIVLPFLPESPRFLYLNRGDETAAKEAVDRFCEPEDAEEVMTALKSEKLKMDNAQAEEEFSPATLFTSKRYRMALILAATLAIVQQLSGINVVMQYSSVLLESTGVSKPSVPFVILGLYALNVLATIVAIPTLEMFGRRTLMLLSLVIVLVSLLSLFIIGFFTPKPEEVATASSMQKAASGIACFFVFFYVSGFAIGLGCITVMYVSEIFQQQARGVANALAGGLQQLTNLAVVLSYYVLEKSMGKFVYLVYVVPVTAGLVLLYLTMLETKNRSVDDIADELSAKMGGPVSKAGPTDQDGRPDASIGGGSSVARAVSTDSEADADAPVQEESDVQMMANV